MFPLALGQIIREYAVTEMHLTLNAGTGVTNAGLSCASLGTLGEQRTTSPVFAFPRAVAIPSTDLHVTMRHMTLPSEHVCTENLTPFLKLLPCKASSGISSSLNPYKLFDADWHGMGLHVLRNSNQELVLRLTFQTVSDPVRFSSSQLQRSFPSLFGRTIEAACPLSSRSASNSIIAKRILRGSGQALGTVSVVIVNNGAHEVEALYLETMPWIVQIYLHTLCASVEGRPRDDLVHNILYIPSITHSRAATLQAVLTLPVRSMIHLTFDVKKAFLRYGEHPPDAQRGWDLPPAVLIPLRNDAIPPPDSRLGNRIYMCTLLVDLATPDFSMPYNVIMISGVVIA
ncbi:GPI transamidase component PIG-T [Mycena rosella]|uniref:GPI transamidase component PIG-T n=1 Tax=Mycena rosella TaxID=1033263 RepID=A0AAD7DCT6_MYCRO|nr:GPI transamidase component PIG-T [Mycena rosella]